jgi:hypothetical protein
MEAVASTDVKCSFEAVRVLRSAPRRPHGLPLASPRPEEAFVPEHPLPEPALPDPTLTEPELPEPALPESELPEATLAPGVARVDAEARCLSSIASGVVNTTNSIIARGEPPMQWSAEERSIRVRRRGAGPR